MVDVALGGTGLEGALGFRAGVGDAVALVKHALARPGDLVILLASIADALQLLLMSKLHHKLPYLIMFALAVGAELPSAHLGPQTSPSSVLFHLSL